MFHGYATEINVILLVECFTDLELRWIMATRIPWMASRDAAEASPGTHAQSILADCQYVVLTARRMKPAGATKHGTEYYLIASNKQNRDRGRNRQNLLQPRFRSFLPHICAFCSHLFGRSSFGFRISDLRLRRARNHRQRATKPQRGFTTRAERRR